ncbi:hypothetical protein DFS34DRAFT_592850 [Phlyctochytrium arcticum]|nr:hypothetical protein DFS34DRAFT_592850 [Phlyctochytrium arcticum]
MPKLFPVVYPLWRTQVKHFLFRWIPHSVTGSLPQWLGINLFTPLHECATGNCPFHRLKFPQARAKVENLVIDAATGCRSDTIHLVFYATGALFTESVLLSRLLRDKRLPKEANIIFSMIGRLLAIAALIRNDEAAFERELAFGYNEEYHLGTTAHIQTMGRIFNDYMADNRVIVRFYGSKEELQLEVRDGHLPRADVVMLIDPGMESFDIKPVRYASLALAKNVLAEHGTLVLGHASLDANPEPVITSLKVSDGTLNKMIASVGENEEKSCVQNV